MRSTCLLTAHQVQANVNRTLAEGRAAEERRRAEAASAHQKRIGMVMQLKREIESDSNRDARAAAKRLQAQADKDAKEAAEREAITAQLGNPEAVFRQRQLQAQHESQQRDLAAKRRQCELDIVRRLQDEEKRRRRNRSQNTATKRHKPALPSPMPAAPREDVVPAEKLPAVDEAPSSASDDDDDVLAALARPQRGSTLRNLVDSDDESSPGVELYMEPEFDSQPHGSRPSPQIGNFLADDAPESPTKGKYDLTTKPLSKLEQRKLAAALAWQKDNIAQKQAGPFIWSELQLTRRRLSAAASSPACRLHASRAWSCLRTLRSARRTAASSSSPTSALASTAFT